MNKDSLPLLAIINIIYNVIAPNELETFPYKWLEKIIMIIISMNYIICVMKAGQNMRLVQTRASHGDLRRFQ